MHNIIEQLEDDHRRMISLMYLLEKELKKLTGIAAGECQYDKLFEILDYVKTVPERWHHPIEDIIFDHYIAMYGPGDAIISQLQQEHVLLEVQTAQLTALLSRARNLLNRPKAKIMQLATSFQMLQLEHIRKERRLLEAIDIQFNARDWQTIDSLIREKALEGADLDPFSLEYYRENGNSLSKSQLLSEQINLARREAGCGAKTDAYDLQSHIQAPTL